MSERIRVLVVDDEPKILKNLLRLLGRAHQIEVVGSVMTGHAAVEEALKTRPDLVLLDLGLPDMDGIVVTSKLKQALPAVEVLIFTVFDDEQKVLAAVRAGAGGYILKGEPFDRVISAITEVAAGGSVIQPTLARALLRGFQIQERENAESPTLTEREKEILNLIGKGLSNQEVASVLGLSRATVRTHLEHIYAKLDVTNRVEAVTEGIRKGLIRM